MEVACLKGKITTDTKVKVTDYGINIKILGTEDKEIQLHSIPSIINEYNKRVYYTQIGTCMYIALEDISEGIVFLYIIEQEIKNGNLKIKNIYTHTIVHEANILERFFRYDAEFEKDNIKIITPQITTVFGKINQLKRKPNPETTKPAKNLDRYKK